MFQDASGLFDEGSSFLRVCHQDGIELSLTNDDMHLSADSAIAEQLLDIKKSGSLTVNLIFTLTVSKEYSRNRHF